MRHSNEIAFFDSLAPKWDSMEIRSTPQRVNAILDLCDIRPGDTVLDLGAGTGVLHPWLAERVGAVGRILAVDFSPRMLEIARRKAAGLGNVSFLELDFEEHAIGGRFDHILLYCVYPHLHNPVCTLRRLAADNLSGRGSIVIAFPNSEAFVNDIHRRRGAGGADLPDAGTLAAELRALGFDAECLSATEDAYVVRVGAAVPVSEPDVHAELREAALE